jgi:hypothetical protein
MTLAEEIHHLAESARDFDLSVADPTSDMAWEPADVALVSPSDPDPRVVAG